MTQPSPTLSFILALLALTLAASALLLQLPDPSSSGDPPSCETATRFPTAPPSPTTNRTTR